jgi:hypothetical protein
MCEANEAAGLSALPEPLVARSNFLEFGGSDVEIEIGVYNGVHSRAKLTVSAVKEASWWALKAHVSVYVR